MDGARDNTEEHFWVVCGIDDGDVGSRVSTANRALRRATNLQRGQFSRPETALYGPSRSSDVIANAGYEYSWMGITMLSPCLQCLGAVIIVCTRTAIVASLGTTFSCQDFSGTSLPPFFSLTDALCPLLLAFLSLPCAPFRMRMGLYPKLSSYAS